MTWRSAGPDRRPARSSGSKLAAFLVLLGSGLALSLVTSTGAGVTRLQAEPERRPQCSLEAAWHETDARLLRIYDGLRKGLEHAHLPRVCQADVEATDADYAAWAKRLAAAKKTTKGPVAFALGDTAAARLARLAPSVPRVLVVTRVTVEGTSVSPLPKLTGKGATVLLALRAERLGEVLTGLLGNAGQPVALPTQDELSARDRESLRAAGAAGGFRIVAPGAKEDDRPRAVLRLRMGLDAKPASFADAAKLARSLGVPLITDEPERFRQGIATVVLAGEFELAGRHAAEAARRMLASDETQDPSLRVVRGTSVWVDLGAADRQGIKLPLPFLASADVLHRPLVAPRRAR